MFDRFTQVVSDASATRFCSGERGRRQIQWAERQLAERGGELIVIGRFLP